MIHPELLSRLCRARDLLRDWEEELLSVTAVARASGLTRFHFIRLFKAMFGETPHQYRSRSQIEKAPDKFTGKPYATAGIIIGAFTLAIYALLFALGMLAGAFS